MKIKLLFLLSLSTGLTAFGQNSSSNSTDTQSLTLAQALEVAVANNTSVKNAYADVAMADQQVKETTAIGIPQVKGQVQFMNALQKQVFVFPGLAAPIRVGNTYTTTASINMSWLMLDATYFLGLKAAKTYTDLAKKAASKTETDVKIDVAKTYFMALIAKENIELLNSNVGTLNKTLTQVKALNKEGFTESLEVDRLQLQLNNLAISKQQVIDQYEIVLGLLKVKMGLSQDKNIKLSDDINSINAQYSDIDTTATLNLSARTDFQLLQQQLTLNKMDVQRYQYSKYPNLVGAATYQQNNMGETLDFGKWYSNSFYALQVNVPIFSGFGNDARIQKAKITQYKTENTIYNAKNLIELDVFQTKQKYLRALDRVVQQKENLDLANRILNISTIKYNEGVGSNLELITATQDVRNTQTNYLSALYDLLVTKLDYQVALGQTIK